MRQTNPQPNRTINVVRTGAEPFINEAGGEMSMRGSVTGSFINRGLCRGKTQLEFYVDAGESLVNDPNGIMEPLYGDLRIFNLSGSSILNNGLWRVLAGKILITGAMPDNYDPVDQSWTGGQLLVASPGQFCVLSPIARLRNFVFHCVNELAQMCSSGGDPCPIAAIEHIDPSSTLIIEDMPFAFNGDLDVEGTAMFINGAVVSAPGQVHSNNTLVVHNSTFIPNSVLIGNGEIIVDNGAILGNIVNNGGRVRPGQSPGRFVAGMNYTQDSNGSLEIEIGGLTPETEHDVLDVGQTATLGGTLEVVLLNGFEPAPTDSFTFLTAAAITGSFDNAPADPNGVGSVSFDRGTFDVTYSATSVTLGGFAAACPGDLNGDNAVSLEDLSILLANFGTTSGADPEDGDLNGDGTVDLADLAMMLTLYGTVCN